MIVPLNPPGVHKHPPWDPGTGQTCMGQSRSRGDPGGVWGLEEPFLFFLGELREVQPGEDLADLVEK